MRLPSSSAIALACLLTASLSPARPVCAGFITNGSFETGTFLGWSTAGNASVQTSSIGIAPTQGTHQALLTTGGNQVSVTVLESDLGLASGTLAGLGNGTLIVGGSAVYQAVSLNKGDQVAFDADFLTNEFSGPGNCFNDFGFFLCRAPGPLLLASVEVPGLSLASCPAPASVFQSGDTHRLHPSWPRRRGPTRSDPGSWMLRTVPWARLQGLRSTTTSSSRSLLADTLWVCPGSQAPASDSFMSGESAPS